MSRGAKPGERRGGRHKGTPNQLTRTVKEVIERVAQGLGGVDGMLAWAQEEAANARIFWGQIYPKLLPCQIKAEHTGQNGQPLVGGVLVVPAVLAPPVWEQAALQADLPTVQNQSSRPPLPASEEA